MAKYLRWLTRAGWTTKPARDVIENALTPAEVDQTFAGIENDREAHDASTNVHSTDLSTFASTSTKVGGSDLSGDATAAIEDKSLSGLSDTNVFRSLKAGDSLCYDPSFDWVPFDFVQNDDTGIKRENTDGQVTLNLDNFPALYMPGIDYDRDDGNFYVDMDEAQRRYVFPKGSGVEINLSGSGLPNDGVDSYRRDVLVFVDVSRGYNFTFDVDDFIWPDGGGPPTLTTSAEGLVGDPVFDTMMWPEHEATIDLGSAFGITDTGSRTFFSPDGSKFYYNDGGSSIRQFALAAPYDLASTPTEETTFSEANFNNINGISFSADGTKAFTFQDFGSGVAQYTLSTPNDLATATLDKVETNDPFFEEVNELIWKPDGTEAWAAVPSGSVYHYLMGTPFDISTGNFEWNFQVTDLVDRNEANTIAFSSDGRKFFVVDDGSRVVYEIALAEPYQLKTRGPAHDFDFRDDNTNNPELGEVYAIHISNAGDKILASGVVNSSGNPGVMVYSTGTGSVYDVLRFHQVTDTQVAGILEFKGVK